MQASSTSQRLAEFLAEEKRALEQAQNELKENGILLRQTSSEIDRITQINSHAIARLREAEASIETYSREALRGIFTAASESQLRLFMMQAQLEQLQSQHRGLERLADHLTRMSEMAADLPSDSGFRPHQETAFQETDKGATRTLTLPFSVSPAHRLMPVETSRQMIAKIIEAQEDERNKVARQIHDGPAQALTNVILRAEICERLLDVDKTRVRGELSELKMLINNSLQQTRRFIFDLRPMILDDLGLIPTLRKYTQAIQERGEVGIELTVTGQERRLPPYFEVAIFRVIQEGLENATKHARAAQTQVTIHTEDDHVEFSVEDNGCGFDAEKAIADARERKPGAVGIADMLERVEALGGMFQIESIVGRGTVVAARLPIPEEGLPTS